MMQDAFLFLKAHCVPPPNNGSEASLAWWMQTATDADELVETKWKNHSLILNVMVGILTYLGEKAKEVTADGKSV